MRLKPIRLYVEGVVVVVLVVGQGLDCVEQDQALSGRHVTLGERVRL